MFDPNCGEVVGGILYGGGKMVCLAGITSFLVLIFNSSRVVG